MLLIVMLEHTTEPSISPRDIVQLPSLVCAPEDPPVFNKLKLDVSFDNVLAIVASKNVNNKARFCDGAQIWWVVWVVLKASS